ncbi:hypothetical protein CRE_20416 [Caenorhabditis remanei]|uniref:Uncharacterized protein n=1 Tax=Caenorhabditis remanei TaxID=31234 RepID=E3MT83_CAERE|nr:hypothetical protein CRE_20416 [Caenorhabditis remanei]
MVSSKAIYKHNDGYILLDDLESWYARGLVESDDKIRIFEIGRNGSCETYTVDSLINTYGVEFPFRRVPRSFSSVENKENSTPETSSASSQNSTLPNDKKTEQRIQVFHRPARTIPVSHKSSIRNRVTYPNQSEIVRRTSDVEKTSDTEAEQFEPKLCVPNKSKKGDMITGDDVVDEMKQLKSALWKQRLDRLAKSIPVAQKSSIWNRVTYPNQLDRIKQTSDTESEQSEPKFPLFYVPKKKSKKGDMITGDDVVDEMKKLKTAFPMKDWKASDDEHFDFLKQTDTKKIRCHICNIFPACPSHAIHHLFRKQHIREMANYEMPRNAFEFWTQHFDKCNQKKH